MSGHGGKRKGAGRKPPPPGFGRKVFSVKLAAWIIEEVGALPESRTEATEKALIEAYNLRSIDK